MTGGEKMSYSKKPAMILFDVGGTLFRDGKCIFRDGLSALRKAALNPDITDDDTLESLWDEYTSEIGWDFRSRDGAVLDMSLSAGIKYATMRAGLKFDIDIFSQEEIFDRFNSSRELMPGIEELLTTLKKAGIRTAVISNNAMSGEGLTLAVDRWLPENNFEFCLTSADILFAKPHKAPFLTAVSLAGLDPSECWYCGDRIAPDIRGGRNGGLTPVLIDEGAKSPLEMRNDESCGEYMAVSSWYSLKDYIENTFGD